MARKRNQSFGTGVVVGAVAAALLVGFVAGRATAPRQSAGTDPVEVAAAGEAPAAGTYVEKKLELDPSPYKGPEDAPIVIYEISDFQ